MPFSTLLVVYSYHHMNTQQIASVFARVFEAQIKSPLQLNPEAITQFDLIGFGSGIDSGKHYTQLLDFVEKLPPSHMKNTFIFSTSAIESKDKMGTDHSALRSILLAKGYKVLDEFSCKGYNTNSFLKYIGGMNKGRPNKEDLQHAEIFARNLQHNLNSKAGR